VAIGVALGVAGTVVLDRWWHRKDAPSGPAASSALPAPSDVTGAADPRVWVVPTSVPEPAPLPPPRPSTRARPVRPDRVPTAATLKLSQRIILHVYAQGRPAEYVAPAALSQAGMGEVLGEPQTHLSKALARLVAGGVLTVERRHVSGGSRRLLVYTLTPLGEALARDMRRAVSPRATAAAPPWMGRP
jgi:DNA-binding MarR family transcriptional regulator